MRRDVARMGHQVASEPPACVDEVDAEVLGLLELRAEVLESWWGLVQDLDVLQAVARLM